MRRKSSPPETPSERLVRDIRRATRKQYSAEEKIRIVFDGLRGEVSIAELCRVIAERCFASTKASQRASTTAGRRNSSKLESGVWPATRRGRQPPAKSRISGAKPKSSRRSLPSKPSSSGCSKKYDRGWGAKRHEIPRVRKARDHPPRRAVPSARAAHAGEARHSAGFVLSLGRSVPSRRRRSPGRQAIQADTRLEPHSGWRAPEDRGDGPRSAGPLTP
jgi:hypothetical protein